MAQLKEQVGGQFSINHRPRNARLTLNLIEQPLWNVLREIQRQSGCGFAERASPDIYLEFEDKLLDPDAPSVQEGPFLIIISGARRESTIDYGAKNQSKNDL